MGSNQWDYILGFSSEYRHIARGIRFLRKNPCQKMEESCSNYEYKFPFDGRWVVKTSEESSSSSSSNNSESTIVVHGNKFYHGNRYSPTPNSLDFSDPLCPVIVWSDKQERQRMVGCFNGRDDVAAVPIGKSIEWLALSSTRPKMLWTRVSVESDNDRPLRVTQFGADHPNKTFYLLDTIGHHTTPPYKESTVWGNTFCQSYTVGLASYHFMEDQSGAYISYEHEHTAVWPPLDNGNPIPSRVWFTNVSFDESTKTFRADIDWMGTHGTSWQGDRIWR